MLPRPGRGLGGILRGGGVRTMDDSVDRVLEEGFDSGGISGDGEGVVVGDNSVNSDKSERDNRR